MQKRKLTCVLVCAYLNPNVAQNFHRTRKGILNVRAHAQKHTFVGTGDMEIDDCQAQALTY